MACKYEYNGREYTQEELLNEIANGGFEVRPAEIFKSVATTKKQQRSNIVNDTLTLLYQRKKEAEDVIQALKNSNESKAVKLQKTAEYRNIIRKTSDTITSLLEADADKQLDFIMDQAAIDAELVKALYSHKSLSFSELQFANNIVETWKNLPEALGISDIFDPNLDPEISNKLMKIEGDYSVLSRKAHAIAVQLIKQASKGKLSEDDITKLIDTTTITQWTRELSTAGIALPNHLAYIIKEVNLKINQEHNKNHALIDKMTAGIKDFSLFVKKQTTRDGKETLGIVTRYSQQFWDNLRSINRRLRKDLKDAGDDKTKRTQAYKAYHAWNEANTIAFNALLFINRNDYTDQQRDAEINRMKALGFNSMEVDNIITESIRLNERFQNRLENYEYDIMTEAAADPSIIPQGITFDDYVKAKVQEFDDINNPLKYMDQKFFGAQKVTAYGGARYTYLIPVKTLNNKDSGYYDANFAKIAADPKLYEFYTWFTRFISDNLSWLPQEEIEDLQSNFLPVVADRIAKEYGFSNLKESVNGLGDWFFKAISSNGFEDKPDVNPFSRKELRQFKSRFINENVSIEDRSTDLNLIAKLFSDMALVYKHKNTVKAEVDTITDVIMTTKGSYKLDKKLNILVRQDKDATNIQSLVDFTVRNGFYGLKSEDKLWQSDELFYDWKELIPLLGYKSEKAKKAQQLSEEIKKLSDALESDQLGEDDRKTIIAARDEKINDFYKLGGRKFSLTKTLDSTISATRVTALGFAPFSAVRNLLVGKINNRLHSAGGRDFTGKELLWANKQLTQSTAAYWSRGAYQTDFTRKMFGLLSDSGMIEGEDGSFLISLVDKKTPLNRFRQMLPKAFTWLSGGDYHFKAEMMLSAMKFDKIKTAKGEEISLWDALNEDREYDVAKYGEWDVAANNNKSFDEYLRDKLLKYRQLANKLHGASGKDIHVKGKETAIGRLLFLFKSWLPETVGVRFDPRHKDAILERDEEGYYMTFYRLAMEKKLGVVKLVLNSLMGRKLDIQDEMTLANFKKAVKELQVLTTLFMAYVMLKAMAPDDDKDKKIYNLLLLRQLHDLNRDLTYYININSAGELQRNAIPIYTTLKNWGNAVKAVGYYSLGVEGKDGEQMYDAERTALKITKVLPVLSNVNRFLYYQKQVD